MKTLLMQKPPLSSTQTIFWLMKALALVFCGSSAWAMNCYFVGGYTTMTLPITLSGDYYVPPTTPVGTVIQEFTAPAPSAGTNYIDCVWAPPGSGSREWAFTNSPTQISSNVYATGVAGIGVKIKNHHSNFLPTTEVLTQPTVGQTINYIFPTLPFLTYQFVVTSMPTGNGAISLSNIPRVRHTFIDTNSTTLVFTSNVTGSMNFTSGTCIVPNTIPVNLGPHNISEFPNPNQPMTSTPTTVTINLNNCPSGMNAIKYWFSATTIPSYPTVVALNGSGVAQGIGVQLTDVASNSIIQYNNSGSPYTLPITYPTIGGSYTISLKASYYRTNVPVQAGSANATVQFTMVYQ